MARRKERDFYPPVHFLKCLNCGKTIYYRPAALHSKMESAPMGNEYSGQLYS
jgi:hypothetical protein